MHIALRASADEVYNVDGENVVPAVHKVLNQIKSFSESVRSGEWKGVTGKPITNIVAIGIGGSYLGANFVYEALHTDGEASSFAQGRQLRFLANVDPVGCSRALEGLNPETTLAIVISKTFTTRETILNARTVRQWFVKSLGSGKDVVAKHMVAVSTNLKDVAAFGIDAEKGTFAFWDWGQPHRAHITQTTNERWRTLVAKNKRHGGENCANHSSAICPSFFLLQSVVVIP